MVAGVCGGLAEYFNVDSSIIRLIFILFTLTGGRGFLIYLILWLVIPKSQNGAKELEKTDRTLEIDEKNKETARKDNQKRDNRNVFGLILLVAGVVILWNQIMPIRISSEWIWPGILIATGIYLIFR